MAQVVYSLASKLNLCVKAVKYVWLVTKLLVFHEITVGATCVNSATYKEQATEFFAGTSAPAKNSSTSRNKLFEDKCNWTMSANIPNAQISVLFEKLQQATYSKPINISTTLSAYVLRRNT
jgi:hypothetical protein